MANNKNAVLNLNRGNPGNKGGGRPSDWLREKCQSLVKAKKIVEYLAAVASGEPVEERRMVMTNTDGKPEVKISLVSACTKDRERASEILLNRGFGMPTQQIESDSLNQLFEALMDRYR